MATNTIILLQGEHIPNGYQWYISPIQYSGFSVHPMFIEWSTQNYILRWGFFKGSAYDPTTNAL